MVFSIVGPASSLRKLKELLEKESAALALISEMVRVTKEVDLTNLLQDAFQIHCDHKRYLEELIRTMMDEPAFGQSIVPETFNAFLQSAMATPRTQFALLQMIETHLMEMLTDCRKLNIDIVVRISTEQEALTQRVNVAIQSLTHVLPGSNSRNASPNRSSYRPEPGNSCLNDCA